VYGDSTLMANNVSGDMPLRLPSTLTEPDANLDAEGKIQCTTCHNPHHNSYGEFLVKSDASDLCLTCHES